MALDSLYELRNVIPTLMSSNNLEEQQGESGCINS